jgi:cyclopropane fatty-acyl-phospholipid synthase-like methyltransferase
MLKPISQPCVRNQEPIYQVLKSYFNAAGSTLELACGTGQHAVYLSERLPHLNWQPSDLAPSLKGANLWIEEAALENLKPAVMLDINDEHWAVDNYDYIYSANLVHFVGQSSINTMFAGIGKHLKVKGLLALYGPYNQNGFTGEGNLRLDHWLKSEINPEAGIKELDDIVSLANENGLTLDANHLMPANNHLLIFKK